MKEWLIFLCNALENIVLALCISAVAIWFENPRLLWFYLLIPINGVRIGTKEEDEDETP